MQPTYRVTCPIDKLTLLPVVLGPESAPWFCMACRHSWWAAELSEKARAQFRPSVEDFGFGAPLAELQSEVLNERDEARARGTSCREDMIELLPLPGAARIANDPRVHQDFRALAVVEVARKSEMH